MGVDSLVQTFHTIGLRKILEEYEERGLVIFEGSTDGTKYGSIEGLLLELLDESIDRTAEGESEKS